MPLAALIFALALVGGLASRSYNVAGTGLNQYFVLISLSGTGKGIISKCFSKVISDVSKKVPAIIDLKGFGYLASGPAIIKWMAKRPYPIAISMLDEIGHDLQEMANPKNTNAKSKEKVLLQMWPLSGAGNVFDPMAYSDTENNTRSLDSPALTIVGTTTPDIFDENLTENLASSGMGARLHIVENTGGIPPYNEAHEAEFNALPGRLIDAVATLAEQALKLANAKQVRPVQLTPEAKAHFTAYAEAQRVRSNASIEGPARQLRNRSHEKALKLAATIAVGKDPFDPCIDIKAAIWATEFLDTSTNKQIAKYENGQTGQVGGNQPKQQSEMRRVIREYFDAAKGKFKNSGCIVEIHKDGYFTKKYLSDRLMNLAAFKHDKAGATVAIKRSIDALIEAGEIINVSRQAMHTKYNTTATCFCLVNEYEFRKPQD